MPVAMAERLIDAPRSEVYAMVDDRHTRMRLLPDNFTDAHLASDEASGPGARFVFTVRTARGAYESSTTVTAHDPPHTLTERTDDGETSYETRWRLTAEDGGTRVRVETHYPHPRRLLHRLLGPIARRALAQSLMVELVRLEQALAGDTDAPEEPADSEA